MYRGSMTIILPDGGGTGLGAACVMDVVDGADELLLLLFKILKILDCSSACFGSLTREPEPKFLASSPNSNCTCSSRLISKYLITLSNCKTVNCKLSANIFSKTWTASGWRSMAGGAFTGTDRPPDL